VEVRALAGVLEVLPSGQRGPPTVPGVVDDDRVGRPRFRLVDQALIRGDDPLSRRVVANPCLDREAALGQGLRHEGDVAVDAAEAEGLTPDEKRSPGHRRLPVNSPAAAIRSGLLSSFAPVVAQPRLRHVPPLASMSMQAPEA
jgi:hypothetical protein